MLSKIAIGAAVAVALFLGYVSTRPSKFYYERSGVINASADKIFPYISDFKQGHLWSPYEKDLTMTKNFTGPDGQVGQVMEFASKDSGSGKLELLKVVPNESVDIRLLMTKPFEADQLVQYKLTPEGTGTKFTWSLSGDGGFMSKLMSVIIDCDKMIGGQMEEGIGGLKALVEAQR